MPLAMDAETLIQDPLSIVRKRAASLTAKALRTPSDWGVPAMFEKALGLNDPRGLLRRIPSLNAAGASAAGIKNGTLVRFRCMVQDVLDPEYYVGLYEERNLSTGAKAIRTAKYQDMVRVPEGCRIDHGDPSTVTFSRIPLFCVPVPGEAAWVGDALGASATRAPAGDAKKRTGGGRKRRADDSVERDVQMTPVKSKTAKSAARAAARMDTDDDGDAVMTGTKTPKQAVPASSRPAASFQSIGCVAKIYDHASSPLKVCDVVELVGVFSSNPVLSQQQGCCGGQQQSWGAFNPSEAAAPRLHVLTFRKVSTGWGLVPNPSKKQAFDARLAAVRGRLAAARTSLVAHLRSALGGDAAAAEAMLVHLVSRVQYRRAGHAIGKFSLSLSSAPQSLAPVLADLLADLVPASKCIEVSIPALNAKSLQSVKDYEANHLVQGELQVARGTHLLFDETRLAEGKLEAQGVKNVGAVQQLIAQQKLKYDFKYHDITFDTDAPVLVLSKGKSIFRCDSALQLKPKLALPTAYAALGAPPKAVAAWREYLMLARQLQVGIPEATSKHIQDAFVRQRQANPRLGQDHMHRQLSFARLLAVTFLEQELSPGRWDASTKLFAHVCKPAKTA